jgi:AcrR family transcriptional regulator
MAASRTQTAGGQRRPYAPRMPAAERREQLLDAALDVIGEHGYGGVTMEAIARRAGVTKPVVYDIFANRGELLMALLGREEARALSLLAEVLPDADSQEAPDTLVVDGFRAFLESVAANPTTWRLIVLPAEGTKPVAGQRSSTSSSPRRVLWRSASTTRVSCSRIRDAIRPYVSRSSFAASPASPSQAMRIDRLTR